MAAQAGVDPKTVSSLFSDMDRRGIVKRSRNKVAILDQEALGQWCCECYAWAKESTAEYLKALAEIARAHGGQTNPDAGEPLQ
jgi:DNA-binding transcriptional regulator YhcF (GntR family)